jgi:hypothetical protein
VQQSRYKTTHASVANLYCAKDFISEFFCVPIGLGCWVDKRSGLDIAADEAQSAGSQAACLTLAHELTEQRFPAPRLLAFKVCSLCSSEVEWLWRVLKSCPNLCVGVRNLFLPSVI